MSRQETNWFKRYSTEILQQNGNGCAMSQVYGNRRTKKITETMDPEKYKKEDGEAIMVNRRIWCGESQNNERNGNLIRKAKSCTEWTKPNNYVARNL